MSLMNCIDALLEPWPSPGSTHSDPDVYFEVSALLREVKDLPRANSKKTVTPNYFLFAPCTVATGKRVGPERHDAARRPARLEAT